MQKWVIALALQVNKNSLLWFLLGSIFQLCLWGMTATSWKGKGIENYTTNYWLGWLFGLKYTN